MITFDAELSFSVEAAGGAGGGQRPMSGTLDASGREITIRFDGTVRTDARRETRRRLSSVARQAARYGLTLSVVDDQGIIVSLGRTRSNPIGRLLFGRHVRIPWPAVQRILRRRRRDGFSLGELLPPGTPLPIAPTFRRLRRRITTTHDPEGGGRPRLLFDGTANPFPGQRPRVFFLRVGRTTRIGGGSDNDLILDGLPDHVADVHRDDHDEYRIAGTGTETIRVNDEPVAQALLRTGTRVAIGSWTMVYFREEYADHGRPYGGRIGGEAGYQRTQPSPLYKRAKAP